MRGTLALCALLLAAAFLRGAPLSPASRKAPPPRNEAPPIETEKFARQLLFVTRQVEAEYIRPLSYEGLLYTALAGLYEGARRPVPRDLRDQVRQAIARPPRAANRPPGDPTRPPDDDVEPVQLLRRVYEEVRGAEALRGQNPLLVACRALTRSLDPHSGLVTAEEQRRHTGLEAECDGAGLELHDNGGNGPALVKEVLAGGPAQRAGVRPGDEITRLDGKPVRGMSTAEVLQALNQPPPPTPPPFLTGDPFGPGARAILAARPVRVTLRRRDQGAPRTVVLRRERFHPETVLGVTRRDNNAWNYFLDPQRRIAHVRLAALGPGTAEELHGVVTRLREDGLRGLILDLRWCPGGYLNEAVGTAEMFLGEGTIATVKSRKQETVYRSTGANKFRDFPLVVLINGETSGGGELIAAALQDHRRAVVVGQRSLGKGSVQTRLYLGLADVGLKLTTATFLRPGGKNLHRFPDSKPRDDWGVLPDAGREFRVSPDLSRALRRWWQQQTLRPGDSNERLPLDDPAADPQQQAALQVLLGQK